MNITHRFLALDGETHQIFMEVPDHQVRIYLSVANDTETVDVQLTPYNNEDVPQPMTTRHLSQGNAKTILSYPLNKGIDRFLFKLHGWNGLANLEWNLPPKCVWIEASVSPRTEILKDGIPGTNIRRPSVFYFDFNHSAQEQHLAALRKEIE
jgi:hypothetical protein